MSETSIALLSRRAQECARPDPRDLTWTLMEDQWDPQSNPNGYVSLGVAENRLMHEELTQRLGQDINLETAVLTYGNGPFGTTRLRKALARFLTKYLKTQIPLDSSQMMITNGVSHSIEHLSWAFADRGDGFLLGQPYYGSFLLDISLRPGVELVEVKFDDIDAMSVDAVQNFETAILEAGKRNVKIKGLMLCSPHNPLGRCYSKDALIAYLKLCEKHQIHLVSDEVYALSVWENKESPNPPPVPFTSILSLEIAQYINPALVHVLWGMSKDFGANGLRVGAIISQHNPALMQALLSVAVYSYVSGISDRVVANVLEDDEWTQNYIAVNQQRLSDAYSHVVSFLRHHDIAYTPTANAAFFVWVDLGAAYVKRHPERKDCDDITQEIMDLLLDHKLFLANGTVFGAETPGIFRIVFSHPREYVDEGLGRMLKALEVGRRGGIPAKLWWLLKRR